MHSDEHRALASTETFVLQPMLSSQLVGNLRFDDGNVNDVATNQ